MEKDAAMMCPYRAACLEKWRVTRLDFRCGFEKYNLLENCPKYEQQCQAQIARSGRVDTDRVEQPDRDRGGAGAGVANV